MKTFKFIIPVEGIMTTTISAKDAQEALDKLLENKEMFEKYEYGQLGLQLDAALIINDENTKISS